MRCHPDPGQEGRHDATPQAHVPRLDARARPHVGPPADLATAHTRHPRGSGLTGGSHRAGHTTRITPEPFIPKKKHENKRDYITRPSAPPPHTHQRATERRADTRRVCLQPVACPRSTPPCRPHRSTKVARARDSCCGCAVWSSGGFGGRGTRVAWLAVCGQWTWLRHFLGNAAVLTGVCMHRPRRLARHQWKATPYCRGGRMKQHTRSGEDPFPPIQADPLPVLGNMYMTARGSPHSVRTRDAIAETIAVQNQRPPPADRQGEDGTAPARQRTTRASHVKSSVALA